LRSLNLQTGRCSRLVAALFGGAVVEVLVLAKPAKRALVDALHDVGDVRLLNETREASRHVRIGSLI
jgi:hypothetical protein